MAIGLFERWEMLSIFWVRRHLLPGVAKYQVAKLVGTLPFVVQEISNLRVDDLQ